MDDGGYAIFFFFEDLMGTAGSNQRLCSKALGRSGVQLLQSKVAAVYLLCPQRYSIIY